VEATVVGIGAAEMRIAQK